MKVSNVKRSQEGFIVSFDVTDATPAFVNSIRRAVIDVVPTMAIEDVEFRTNNSAMFDEMFAHRLGLLPLTTDLQSYTFRDGEGSAANQCTLTLEAQGPCTVTASMIKSNDDKVKPVFGETVIAELLEGQDVAIEAKAILGRGREHAKWSSGNAYFQIGKTVTVKSQPDGELAKKRLPDGAFDSSGKVDAKAITEHNLIDAVEGVFPDEIAVDYDDTTHLVTVESWGQLPGVDVVKQSVTELRSELKQLKESLEALK